MFEIRGKVDTDKLKGIAEDLKRIGMPAQGRALLATLNLAPDGDVRNLPSAVRDVLVKMGAGPQHLAVAHDELPLKRLHQMFCGDRPPISIWHDDAGDVVFFTDPSVDTGEVLSIAKRLARCGMTAQGASLLVSLIVRGHDLDQDAKGRLLRELAVLLWHRPEVQLPGMFLPKLRVLLNDPALIIQGGLFSYEGESLHTQWHAILARHVTEPSKDLPQEILASQPHARRDMAQQLDLIDARLRKLPDDPLSRELELYGIVSELVLMHDAALNANSDLMVNAVLDRLVRIRSGLGTLIHGLVQRELTDQEWNKLEPLVSRLILNIHYTREQPACNSMMDIFLALTKHSETVRKTLIEILLPRLLHRPRRNHVMVAACLAAFAAAIGDTAYARALLKDDAHSTVYFLICLNSHSRRQGDWRDAEDYMLQAIEHYTKEAANSQTFDVDKALLGMLRSGMHYLRYRMDEGIASERERAAFEALNFRG